MRRERLWQVINILFWVAVAFACIRFVVPRWREFQLSARVRELDPGWLTAAGAWLVLQYVATYTMWRRLLRLLGSHAAGGGLFRAFGLSLLAKYVPGRLLGPGLRGRLALASGLPAPAVVASLIWETGFALTTAAGITLLGLLAGAAPVLDAPSRWVIGAIAGAIFAGAALLLVRPVRGLLERWAGLTAFRRQLPAMLVQYLYYVGVWLLSTAAHWSLARAIAPVGVALAFPLLVALAASWIVGALSLFAPAGLGIREGALFVFARPLFGSADALLFVTLSRLMIFAVELVLTLIAWRTPASERG